MHDTNELARQPVALPLPAGGALRGDYRPGPRERSFAVLWLHGFGSYRGGEKSATLAAECHSRGWTFARFDFRGHGESSGEMHELRSSRLLEDVEFIRQFLADRGHTRLGLVGSSMGGFAAAWFAARRPECVLGSVLLAPGFRFPIRRWELLSPAEREQWERTGRLRIRNEWVETELGYGLVEERGQFLPADLAKLCRTPTLIFHGLTDDIVPVADSLDFLQHSAYPGIELRLFKDGDHRLTAYKDEIAAETGRFFTRLLNTP